MQNRMQSDGQEPPPPIWLRSTVASLFILSAPLVCIFGVGNGTASAAYMVSAGLLIRYFFFARPERDAPRTLEQLTRPKIELKNRENDSSAND